MGLNTKLVSPRLAPLAVLRREVLPGFMSELPSDETLRDWFRRGHVPAFKCNPSAKRGGGRVHYDVSAVEKLLKRMIRPLGN